MIDFGGKKTRGNGDVAFNIHALIKEGNDELVETSFSLAQIARLVNKSENITDIVLQDGARVSVGIAMRDLNQKLAEISLSGEELDLREACNAVQLSMIMSLFNSCAKGTGRPGGGFKIKAHMRSPHSSSEKTALDTWSTVTIYRYRASANGDTYIWMSGAGATDRIIPIPFPLFEQLYTHAQQTKAELLDLTVFTDPVSPYQRNASRMQNIPKIYQETTVPQKK